MANWNTLIRKSAPFGISTQVVPNQDHLGQLSLAPVLPEKVLIQFEIAVRHEDECWAGERASAVLQVQGKCGAPSVAVSMRRSY